MSGPPQAPQQPPGRIEGPTALGGNVSQQGQYVAGHDLSVDQSVHNVGLLAAWLNRRRRGPTLIELNRARRDLLEEMGRSWLQALSGSLSSVARFELGLQPLSSAVETPLRAVLRLHGAPDRPMIARGTSIASVFQDVGRQLLILGEPGAGKTTLLLELAQQLLGQAEIAPGERMTVIFRLASWATERRPLAEWLVGELHKHYGVATQLGRLWIESEQIIPLLDGLDEVASEHRAACVQAINLFHDDHGQLPLVISSRTYEYERLPTKLRLRGAVVIQPLTRQDVVDYLERAGESLRHVRAALESDEQLWLLLRTPLFLSVVALTYQSRVPGAGAGDIEERRRRVLSDYVEAVLDRPRAQRFASRDTVRWLAWLARAMRERGQTVLSPDWMQPDLLSHRGGQLATLGVAASVGTVSAVCFGLAAALVFHRIGQPIIGLDTAAVAGPIFGLVTGLGIALAAYDPTIAPTEPLRWSWQTLQHTLLAWLPWGLVAGVGIGGMAGTVAGLRVGAVGLLGGALGGMTVGLGLGLGGWLLGGLEARLDVTPATPGRAISMSGRNAVLSGIVTLACGGAIAALVSAVIQTVAGLVPAAHLGPGVGLIGGLGSGLAVGVIGGLLFGVDLGVGRGPRGVLLITMASCMAGTFAGILTASQASILGATAADTLVLTIAASLIIALLRGGGAYLRHHALRWLLAREGVAPENIVVFLDYAVSLTLMRRQGGGYEFVHRLLRDDLAHLDEAAGPPR